MTEQALASSRRQAATAVERGRERASRPRPCSEANPATSPQDGLSHVYSFSTLFLRLQDKPRRGNLSAMLLRTCRCTQRLKSKAGRQENRTT